MAKGISCANRSCGHQFAADADTAGAKCPRCGTLQPAPLLAQPVPPPRQRPAGDYAWFAIYALLAILLVGAVLSFLGWENLPLIGRYLAAKVTEPPAPARVVSAARESERLNYRFILPEKPWEPDDRTHTDLKGNILTWKRTGPDAWLALGAREFPGRAPRDAVLVDDAVARLQGYFQESLQFEQADDALLAGEKAQRLLFEGERGGMPVKGECWLVKHRGIAYWIITWAPTEEAERMDKEFTQLRRGFDFVHGRAEWSERRPETQTFAGTKLAYSLRDTEDLWRSRNLAGYDPAGDLALLAVEKLPHGEAERFAEVVVLVLEPSKEPPAARVRAYVENRHKKQDPKAVVTLLSERDGMVGSAKGHITRLRVQSENRDRLLVLAVAPGPDALVALHCSCDWRRRSLWERDFQQLWGTLRLK